MNERPPQPDTEQPISPDAPTAPYWPVSTELETDFERQHPDYIESP